MQHVHHESGGRVYQTSPSTKIVLLKFDAEFGSEILKWNNVSE
jgi:hypothetical protein